MCLSFVIAPGGEALGASDLESDVGRAKRKWPTGAADSLEEDAR